jgi:hypothetical protein
MELEAEVQKLKELNAELQKKQVRVTPYHFCTLFSVLSLKGILITYAQLSKC